MTNRLSFMTLGCPDWDLETIAKNAAAYGFGGVELRAVGDKHVDASMDKKARQGVRDLFARHNVALPSLAGYSTFNTDDEAKQKKNTDLLLANIDLGYDLGSKTVRTFIGDKPKEMSYDQAIDIAAKNIAPCARIARDRGIAVVLETHDDYCDPVILRKVFDAMGDCGAMVLWDMQNAYLSGEEGEGMIKLFKGLIGHTHIRDCRRLPEGKHTLVLMGEGEMPFEKILKNLDATGYTGPLSLEWEKMWVPELPDPEVAFPNYVEHMKKLGAA